MSPPKQACGLVRSMHALRSLHSQAEMLNDEAAGSFGTQQVESHVYYIDRSLSFDDVLIALRLMKLKKVGLLTP